jgi:hypothetical protein
MAKGDSWFSKLAPTNLTWRPYAFNRHFSSLEANNVIGAYAFYALGVCPVKTLDFLLARCFHSFV